MATMCDSSLLGQKVRESRRERTRSANGAARAAIGRERICWNCAGTMRHRDTNCPRCGAERLHEGDVITWRVPEADTRRRMDLIRVAGLLAAFLGGVVWLTLRVGLY